jgi:ATP-dependent Clp protease ATP-binding subunit ClpA
MTLLRRRVSSGSTMRPADRALGAAAAEARRLGHGYIGTEHLLLALTRDPQRRGARILSRLGVSHDAIRRSAVLTGLWAPRIDPDALATLGIELDRVRESLEEEFGRGALEQTRAGKLEPSAGRIQCIAPRLKQALADALERARDELPRDEHLLLGILSVPDSLAARALAELGVSFEAVESIVRYEAGW